MTLWNSKWSVIDSTVISGGFLFLKLVLLGSLSDKIKNEHFS